MDGEKLSILADVEDATIKYVDFIKVSAGVDSVLISFAQRLPKDTEQENRALLLGNFVFTWPRFADFAEKLNKVLSENRENAAGFFKKSMYPESDV